MSSRAFPAKTTHTASCPQLCGLSSVTACVTHIPGLGEVPGAIRGLDTGKATAQDCFYLTCRGDQAQPASQIQRGTKDDDYASGYRIVPSGKTREVGRPPYTRRIPIFKWQEWQCRDEASCLASPNDCAKSGHKGGWHDVVVWEKMVHASCAEAADFDAPEFRTQGHRGMRTEGFAHQVEKTAESPMMDLARALDAEDPCES